MVNSQLIIPLFLSNQERGALAFIEIELSLG